MSETEITRDPVWIRASSEARGERPSVVNDAAPSKGTGAILAFHFAEPDARLNEVGWTENFENFDVNNLAALKQVKSKSGKMSHYYGAIDCREYLPEGATSAPDGSSGAEPIGFGIATKFIHARCGDDSSLRHVSNW